MNTAVIVFSTHLKLKSLITITNEVKECTTICFVTPQYVFENEREFIRNIFQVKTIFHCFADFLTDAEGEKCDSDSFIPYLQSGKMHLSNMHLYFNDLTAEKNRMLVKKVEEMFYPTVKIVLSNDLGINSHIWESYGYKRCYGEYYDNSTGEKRNLITKIFTTNILGKIARRWCINYPQNLYVSYYEGKKIIYHGHLERAGYRMNLAFHHDRKEEIKFWIIKLLYVLLGIKIDRKNVINLTTLHEYGNYAYYDMIDIPEFHNYLFQDGYLPPNDTCKYLFFYGKNSKFYSWDKLGNKVFEYHQIPVEIAPFRNIFPIPNPHFKPVKKVLCVSSGAGDWTAIKNRSDEDKTMEAFVEIAKLYPNIEFVYRCHPSWVSPTIQGVNSIQRVVDYIQWLRLPNFQISSNIPAFYDSEGKVVVSHKRSSLEADLRDCDFVFGVHSISMIDGAMNGIPFASVNLSGRRNLWKGISDLGFPHCEDVKSIAEVIDSVMNIDFQTGYLNAVKSYNQIISEV